jgi:1-acyl-sn-glycerol-3-phosphate acyltransferase
MVKYITGLLLRLFGFKITGRYPHELDKKVIAVIPHTSNWDFPLGLLIKWSLGAKINFIAKDSLFKNGFGWFFRALGGIPVNRSKSTNMVQAIVDAYNREDKLSIAIAPEGTRKKVDKLKRGFYFIAKLAKVPVIFVKFDYQNKEVNFSEPYHPTDDEEADWKYINSYFNGVLGRIPEYSYGYGKESGH